MDYPFSHIIYESKNVISSAHYIAFREERKRWWWSDPKDFWNICEIGGEKIWWDCSAESAKLLVDRQESLHQEKSAVKK